MSSDSVLSCPSSISTPLSNQQHLRTHGQGKECSGLSFCHFLWYKYSQARSISTCIDELGVTRRYVPYIDCPNLVYIGMSQCHPTTHTPNSTSAPPFPSGRNRRLLEAQTLAACKSTPPCNMVIGIFMVVAVSHLVILDSIHSRAAPHTLFLTGLGAVVDLTALKLGLPSVYN